MDVPLWVWILFNVVVLSILALDLGVFNRHAHVVTVREALTWTSVWVSLSLIFNIVIWQWQGGTKGIEFLTGYLIEYSLSVDNIFVFVLLFTYFKVPAQYQHRVLFWGIIGALIMRGIMIAIGAALISRFQWILLLFGVFLIFTGIRLGLRREESEEVHPEGNILVRIFQRFMPVTKEMRGEKFFVRENGRLFATPLFLVLLIVESTDLLFAVDSIPAIFGITTDPFIVYTSNVCAILGLRSLYFLLAGVMDKFHYLQLGLAVILTFVGIKMVIPEIAHYVFDTEFKIPTAVSLGVIVLTLAVAIIASLIRARRIEEAEAKARGRNEPVEASQ
jgi:tellurite resistance protein TerC